MVSYSDLRMKMASSKNYIILAMALVIIALVAFLIVDSCAMQSGPSSQGETNFRLLMSDEANAITDFESLHVTISKVGVHQAGENGTWQEFTINTSDDPDKDGVPGINLRALEGENALEIWSGNLSPGDYTKVFIYVDSINGTLTDGQAANVSLPSDKLQISKPFTVANDSQVNFVYDITVVKAGGSGKYNLQPQIGQSGANQSFNDVTPPDEEEPEETEVPEATETPESTESPEETEVPEATETPEATESPDGTEVPEGTETSEITETPEATETLEATETPEATEEPEEGE